MPEHIGIVACSAEGAALCYRTICREASALMGEHHHPEVSMHTYPLADYMIHVRRGDWDAVGDLMIASRNKLAATGATLFICPDNTIHQAYDRVAAAGGRWLHIADVVACRAKALGYSRVGVLGTRYLMEGPVYPGRLAAQSVGYDVPDAETRQEIDRIIFSELVMGVFSDASRTYFQQVIARLGSAGCDAVVLGCTEIPLLIEQKDSPLPVLDSTRLLARVAIESACPLSPPRP